MAEGDVPGAHVGNLGLDAEGNRKLLSLREQRLNVGGLVQGLAVG